MNGDKDGTGALVCVRTSRERVGGEGEGRGGGGGMWVGLPM